VNRGARLSALLLWAVACPAPAQETPAPASTWRAAIDRDRDRLDAALGGVQLSAFGDVLSDEDGQGRRRVDFHAVELDLTRDLGENLQMAAAGVHSHDATQMPVAFLDWHPFGEPLAPRGRLSVEKGFHVQVGRFDVPFGDDWQFYASKDSTSISRPVTTTAIMGAYNDAGARVLGNNGTFNFNAYLLRGFEPGRLVGGRLGFTPFSDPFSLKGTRAPKPAEFGLSWFYDATSDWRKQGAGAAADAEGRLGPCYARAEYLLRQTRPEALPGPGTFQRGWHFTQEATLPWPATAFLRYERMWVEGPDPAAGAGHDERLAGGLSATLKGVFQLKLEGQHYLAASGATRSGPAYTANLWLAQCVVVF